MPDQPENPPESPSGSEGPSADRGRPISALPRPVDAIDPDDLPDQIDPDFERLTPTRPRRSPLAALAVIAIGVVLLIHLAPDLRYSLANRAATPVELGPARALSFNSDTPLRDNTLVAVTGLPDYRNALLFEPKGDSYRRAFFRLLGTGDRLWVRAEQTSTRHDLSERVVGRLRRFDSLPYADQVRAYYGTLKVTRLLDLLPFQKGAANANELAASLVDRGGQRVVVSDLDRAQVAVTVDFADELLVTLSTERFAVEEDARHEVERLGVPVGPARAEKGGFTYAVRVEPGKKDALLTACEAKEFGVRVRRERFLVSLASLVAPAGAAGLSIIPGTDGPAFYDQQGMTLVSAPAGNARLVPWARIDSIQIDAQVTIPSDAWLVTEADLPGDYGWAEALAGLLALFLLANVWLLTRSLRGR